MSNSKKTPLVSGVYVKVKGKTKDVLELSDVEFVNLLINELNAFKNEKTPSETLILRVVTTYFNFIKTNENPEKRNYARIAALLALEKMGRRFTKVKEEWNKCINSLGINSLGL